MTGNVKFVVAQLNILHSKEQEEMEKK